MKNGAWPPRPAAPPPPPPRAAPGAGPARAKKLCGLPYSIGSLKRRKAPRRGSGGTARRQESRADCRARGCGRSQAELWCGRWAVRNIRAAAQRARRNALLKCTYRLNQPSDRPLASSAADRAGRRINWHPGLGDSRASRAGGSRPVPRRLLLVATVANVCARRGSWPRRQSATTLARLE
eukprot:COSAG04_NODE_696_length_11062_cov_47.390769_2_plen_180_part_00